MADAAKRLGPLFELYQAGCEFQRGNISAARLASCKHRALEALSGDHALSFAGVLFHLRALRQSNILTADEHTRGIEAARLARLGRS